MKSYKNNKLGFSLIEVSVVILIISVLIFGIIKSGYIVTKAKINTARSLTSASSIKTIPDLFAWWETAMESSIHKQHRINNRIIQDIDGIGWFDRSSNQNNANNAMGDLLYKEVAINGIPAIYFPGSNGNGFDFDASNLVYKDFTIFIVEQIYTNTTRRHISWGGGRALGYSTGTTIAILPTLTPSGNVTVSGYNDKPTPRIITYMLSSSILPFTQGVFLNGGNGSIAASTSVSQTTSFVNIEGRIGKRDDGGNPFLGDIAEIIIYTRALNIEERNEVQKYLSKKYDIKVTPTTI